jgi:nicotinate-nucleotide adenylyltransferase
MRIAIFGGSFDPPHMGHVLCAVYAQKTAGLDEVWVLPSFEHPYGKHMLEFDKRMQMCEYAFRDLSFVRVCNDEKHNDGGKMVNLIEQLQHRHPGNEWFLVGGTDTAQDLPNWYRGEDLQKLAALIAVPRQGFDNNHPAALPAISSSLVRARIKAGESIEGLVPAAVIEFITVNACYR